jgi:hypothetical protein
MIRYSIPGRGRICFSFPKCPDRLWGPTQPPIQWVQRFFLLRQQHLYPSGDGCLLFPYPKWYSDSQQYTLFNLPYLNANELRPKFTQDHVLYRRALIMSKVMESESYLDRVLDEP